MIYESSESMSEMEFQSEWEICKKLLTCKPNTRKLVNPPTKKPRIGACVAHAHAHDSKLVGLDLNGLDPLETQPKAKAQFEVHEDQKTRPKWPKAKT